MIRVQLEKTGELQPSSKGKASCTQRFKTQGLPAGSWLVPNSDQLVVKMALIDIESRKQLFLDDYLLESLHNTRPVLNRARKYENNPVLRPDRPWEGLGEKYAWQPPGMGSAGRNPTSGL